MNADAELRRLEAERDRAVAAAAKMESERDAARAEAERLRRDIAWTMQRLKISDLLFHKSEPIPAAAEGWLPLFADLEDSRRIEWLNAHARVSANDKNWLVAWDHGLANLDVEIPTPYNMRHLIDLSREGAARDCP